MLALRVHPLGDICFLIIQTSRHVCMILLSSFCSVAYLRQHRESVCVKVLFLMNKIFYLQCVINTTAFKGCFNLQHLLRQKEIINDELYGHLLQRFKQREI